MQPRRRLIGIAGFAGTGKDTLADLFIERGAVRVGLADPVKRAAKAIFDFPVDHLWGPSASRSIPDERYLRGYRLPCGCLVKLIDMTGQVGIRNGVQEILDPCAPKHRDDGNTRGWFRGRGYDFYELKPEYLTPRLALQKLGTEMGRGCYENIWIENLVRTTDQLMHPSIDLPGGGTVVQRYNHVVGIWPEAILPEATRPPPASCVVVPDVRFKNEVDGIRAAGGLVIRIHRGGVDAPYQHQSELELKEIPDASFDFIFHNNGTLEEFLRDGQDVVEVALGRLNTLASAHGQRYPR